MRAPRARTEAALLAGIKEQFLSEAAFQRFQRAVTAELKKWSPDVEGAKRRITKAEHEVENLMTALRAGIITAGTKSALMAAEAEKDAAKAALAAMLGYQPTQMLPRARESWRQMVGSLEDHARNAPGAREALLGGLITINEEAGNLFAEITGSSTLSQIGVVAGAGFEPATFGL